VRKDLPRFCGRQIAVTVAPQVAEQLLTTEKDGLRRLGEQLGRQIEVRARPGLHQEQFEVTALDAGPPVSLPLRWLGGVEPAEAEASEGLDLGAPPEDLADEAVAELEAEGDGHGAPAELDDPGESPILPAPETSEEP
jgi:hypothetical protein